MLVLAHMRIHSARPWPVETARLMPVSPVPDRSLLLIRFIVFFVWGVALAETLWQFSKLVERQYQLIVLERAGEKFVERAMSEDGAVEWWEQFEKLSKINLAPLVLRLIFLFTPLIIYGQILLPWCASPSRILPASAAVRHRVRHAQRGRAVAHRSHN